MYHFKCCTCFTVTGMKVWVPHIYRCVWSKINHKLWRDNFMAFIHLWFIWYIYNHIELNMVSKAGRCAFVFNVISQCTSKGFQNKYKSCGGNLNSNAKPQSRKKKVITSFFHACIFLSFLHHHDCSACAEWWGGVHVK